MNSIILTTLNSSQVLIFLTFHSISHVIFTNIFPVPVRFHCVFFYLYYIQGCISTMVHAVLVFLHRKKMLNQSNLRLKCVDYLSFPFCSGLVWLIFFPPTLIFPPPGFTGFWFSNFGLVSLHVFSPARFNPLPP